MSVFNHTYGSDTDRRVNKRFFFSFSFFSRRFCQYIVKTGQRTHIKRRRTCSSSSSLFFFFYHLYRWLLVDFNKTIDVSTQLRRMQLFLYSVYRLMATFCSRWLKAVVNNNEWLWLRHTNKSKSSALNIRLLFDRSRNLFLIMHHHHHHLHYYYHHHIGKKTYVIFLKIKISI